MKSEITMGLKLHIAPMQFNFLEVWNEKKIYLDDANLDQSQNEINKTRTEIITNCFNSAVDSLNQSGLIFDQKHLLTSILNEIKNVDKQEITIDIPCQKEIDDKPSNDIPMIQPSAILEGMFKALNSNKVNNSNKQDYDPSDDINDGIIAGEFQTIGLTR